MNILEVIRNRDIRNRILFTIVALLIFRVGTYIPIPGIDTAVLRELAASNSGDSFGLLDYFDFFSGGAFSNFSVLMLGVFPYISASIIMQLALLAFPAFKKDIRENPGGQERINFYTRVGTVFVAITQGLVTTVYAQSIPEAIFIDPALYFFLSILTTTTGVFFLLWLGEQITAYGVGNGVSVVIFAGIVARLPSAFNTLLEQARSGLINPLFIAIILALFAFVVVLVIYEHQGQRRIPVAHARSMAATNNYIPLRINPSGVIPVIFASSVLTFLVQILSALSNQYAWARTLSTFFNSTGLGYLGITVILIVLFSYFYTQATLNPAEVAKNIRESGGAILGVRSDKTETYLRYVLYRILLPGSLFLVLIAIVPNLLQLFFSLPAVVAYSLGGTSMLILVGVCLDTVSKIKASLKMTVTNAGKRFF